MTRTTSATMTEATYKALTGHLVRGDGQEDICLALYAPSTGETRTTAIMVEMVPPRRGDRAVHGNASLTGDYVVRAATKAAERGLGIAILHSHPGGRGWQRLSEPDQDAEHGYANLAREITGLPLVGLTLAGGDHSWSARHWDTGRGRDVTPTHSVNVRVIGSRLDVTWNDDAVRPPRADGRLASTVSAWGDRAQADLARRRLLVVGAGSVGLDLILRLAAAGATRITVIDHDIVELRNLDRLVGAGPWDVLLGRSKVAVAQREALAAATGELQVDTRVMSICDPEAIPVALDHDLILCAVDRPWPRAVLNSLAYSDLIPVIDGGLAVDTFPDGRMRNCTWRSHVIRPGRPCMQCAGQIDGAQVSLDLQGLLDDPSYISGLPPATQARLALRGANVAPLSVGATAAIMAQYVSLSVAPGGTGDPGPLRYALNTHHLEHVAATTTDGCPYEDLTALGDARLNLTGERPRSGQTQRPRGAVVRIVDQLATAVGRRLRDRVRHRLLRRLT